MTDRAHETMNSFEYTTTGLFGEVDRVPHPGITIREYAAIQIAAALANDREQCHQAICEEAVSIADKLLAELEAPR